MPNFLNHQRQEVAVLAIGHFGQKNENSIQSGKIYIRNDRCMLPLLLFEVRSFYLPSEFNDAKI